MTPPSPPSPWRDTTNQPTKSKPVDVDFDPVITFTVFHEVSGAPRMTQRDRWKGRECVLKYHAFRDAIRRDAPPLPPVERIDSLSWMAYFAIKKGSKHKIHDSHREKPDRDNIDKAILDALFEEDSGIAAGTICKVWGLQSMLIVKIVVLPRLESTCK